MDDLISRQAAIDAIKWWGLIDGLAEGQAIEILSDEEKLPSAQSEIIRCKDCKWNLECCRTIRSDGRRDDDYCSYAERKES